MACGFSANGAKVYITGRRTELLEKAAKELSEAHVAKGGQVIPSVRRGNRNQCELLNDSDPGLRGMFLIRKGVGRLPRRSGRKKSRQVCEILGAGSCQHTQSYPAGHFYGPDYYGFASPMPVNHNSEVRQVDVLVNCAGVSVPDSAEVKDVNDCGSTTANQSRRT
jgi:NAD(P)-dependent dehydrogenase (short-subunit alcohol dehydrogenase family)